MELNRPIRLNSAKEAIGMIRDGRYFDDVLDEIIVAAQRRKAEKRQKLIDAVKAEFGPTAHIETEPPR